MSLRLDMYTIGQHLYSTSTLTCMCFWYLVLGHAHIITHLYLVLGHAHMSSARAWPPPTPIKTIPHHCTLKMQHHFTCSSSAPPSDLADSRRWSCCGPVGLWMSVTSVCWRMRTPWERAADANASTVLLETSMTIYHRPTQSCYTRPWSTSHRAIIRTSHGLITGLDHRPAQRQHQNDSMIKTPITSHASPATCWTTQ